MAPRLAADASRRLRRLLAIVGWLARVGEAPIAEVAAAVSASPRTSWSDELELAACCGLPPYSPDDLLEIIVTTRTVEANLPEELARPRRLTAAEGFALAAAARTILAVPVPTRTAPGQGAGEARRRPRGRPRWAWTSTPRRCWPTSAGRRRPAPARDRVPLGVGRRDHSAGGGPPRVVSLDGHWYLDAYCHRAAGPPPVPGRPDPVAAGARDPGPGSAEGDLVPEAFVRVRARSPSDSPWTRRAVGGRHGPGARAGHTADGRVEVTLAVGGTAWLERLLLQLGPHAQVLSPPDLVDVGRRAACGCCSSTGDPRVRKTAGHQ